jgi:sulfate adenylyltransferase subunit 1 (EFTu-like GTPase family)
MDLLDYRFKDFKKLNARLLSFLKALGIRPYCVIPLSAKEGENIVSLSKRMPWYRGEFLLQALDNMQPAQKEGKKPLRFCVQDTYQSGKEKIILGKVLSGSIKKNQRAVVMPSFKKIKIKAIRVYKEKRARAAAGESIGLIIRPALHIRRGGIISHPASPLMPRHKFNSRIFWLSAKPLRTQRHAFLRILAQEACCSVEKITQRINSTTLAMLAKESKELRLNEVAQVSWETKQPLLMENFSFIEELGRFVVESKNSLLGIGIITE